MFDIRTVMENKTYAYAGLGIFGAGFSLYCLRRYFQGPVYQGTERLDGKVVIITGANTGIGKETAVDMAKRGGTVIIACRDEKKGLSALSDIRERSGNSQVFLKKLDLASLQSVKDFASSFISEYQRIDILINNAGVMICPYMKTQDGFEMQLGVNHLGHFALTNLLIPRLKESAPSRIVNLSSMGHYYVNGMNFDDLQSEKKYDSFVAYGQSKLANILFTKELANKMTQYSGVCTFAVHPGAVATDLERHSVLLKIYSFLFGWIFSKTPYHGAQTTIYCALQKGIESESGSYYADCARKKSSEASCDAGAAKKLWEVSEDLTGVKYPL